MSEGSGNPSSSAPSDSAPSVPQEVLGRIGDLVTDLRAGSRGSEWLLRGRLRSWVGDGDQVARERLAPLGVRAHVERSGPDRYLVVLPRRGGLGKERFWLHGLLFLSTLGTTLYAGAILETGRLLPGMAGLLEGLLFALPLLAIILSHELGHYLTARRYGLDASLPFFIPFPPAIPGLGVLNPIGTFGAVIRIRSPMPTRRVLVEIAAAGPIAGFLVTLPVLILGLLSSTVQPIGLGDGLRLGEPFLLEGLTLAVIGPIPPGYDLFLSPMAFAGWLGLLLTALNLVPVGQLDGGHIAYALLGRWYRAVSRLAFVIVLALGFFWPGWFVLGAFMLFMRLRHPPLLDEGLTLDGRRKVLGWATLGLLALCFMPVPVALP